MLPPWIDEPPPRRDYLKGMPPGRRRRRRLKVDDLRRQAEWIDPTAAAELEATFADVGIEAGRPRAIAVLLGAAYPAVISTFRAIPELAAQLARTDLSRSLDVEAQLAGMLGPNAANPGDRDTAKARLRHHVRFERLRIALRELLPEQMGGVDVDVTAGELTALAEASVDYAFEEAYGAVLTRLKEDPLVAPVRRSRFVVLGMGKLGGEELNPGSDVDLIYIFDDDAARSEADAAGLSEFWTRVARRMTDSLEDITEDGFAWRVDLRLRPDGGSGPIVVSRSGAERYYESFGRLWERAALLRARPIAGDREFGDELLEGLAPFVWRRRTDPSIANEMIRLVWKARAELGDDEDRDLKLGPGGIREAEFFAQTLALIWGGRDHSLRLRGTLTLLERLRTRGLVTDRELQDVFDAYLALRRAEHYVQTATGHQTHSLPTDLPAKRRLARALGFEDWSAFDADLSRHRQAVSARFRSLSPQEEPLPTDWPWAEAAAALDRSDETAFVRAFAAQATKAAPTPSRVRDVEADERLSERMEGAAQRLFELARHPDSLLGARSRERFDSLTEIVLESVADAADPEQAAHYLASFFSRLRVRSVYVQLLADDPQALRRLVAVLGASAFVGDALIANPELGDTILFDRTVPSPEAAAREILLATGMELSGGGDGGSIAPGPSHADEDPDELFVGTLRRAQTRLTVLVALADLAGDITVRQALLVLSSIADASLEAATRRALGVDQGYAPSGLSVIAMGKLGGREIGYGSDLDVLFVFDPKRAPPEKDPTSYFARVARRIISFISMPHFAGKGYELDTRLRPSGSQGLLVTSIEAFAAYHEVDKPIGDRGFRKAATWERMALLRARPCAGDRQLGERVGHIARATAFGGREKREDITDQIMKVRERVRVEVAEQRFGRHDLKYGEGGLMEVEFATQLLQMVNPDVVGVRASDTLVALEALAGAGILDVEQSEALIDGYLFLRRLEQRIRIVQADGSHLLDELAPGIIPLARRMGFRPQPGQEDVAELLLHRYREVTSRVHVAYVEVVEQGGVKEPVPASVFEATPERRFD